MQGGSGGSSIDPIKLLKQYYPMLILAFLIGTGLGIAAHFVLQRTYPIWTAKAMFQVSDPVGDPTQGLRNAQSRDEQERYLGTQVQLMMSNIILTQAVKDRNFVKTEWARPFVDAKGTIEVERAVKQLQKDVSARMLPQTSLLQLSMSTHRDIDCAIIANAIAEAYMDDHRSRNRTSSSNQRTALMQRINALKEEISSQETARDTLLKENKLDSMEDALSATSMETNNITREQVDVSSKLSGVEARLKEHQDRLKANRSEQISDSLKEQAKRDPVLNQADQKIASLKDSESALLKQGYGVNHPEVAAIRANIDAAERGREEHLDKLLLEMRAAEVADIQSAINSLSNTKKQFEEERALLDARRQTIVQAKVRLGQIDGTLMRLKDELQKMGESLSKIEITIYRQNEKSEAMGDRLRIIAPAETPKSMSFPQLKMMAPVGAILVTGLVGGLIFLREVLDQRVRGPHDAGMVPRVKVLGIVPQASDDPSRPTAIETVFRDAPNGVLTESFRQIRAPLIQKMQQSGHKSLLVIGGMPGSGATTVASNLALGCAGAGERVLIIDANFRRPAMQRVFKLADGAGLGNVLAGSATLDAAVQATSVEGLWVLPAGTPDARAMPERLAGESMSRLMLEASAKYDRIFVDVPPAIVASDGMSVASRCDAAIVVVRAYSEKRGLLARIRNQLGDTRADFLGVVVNAVRASAGGYFKRNIKATHQYQQLAKK